jgi:putative nucleotidyltransferase with HDIG domain
MKNLPLLARVIIALIILVAIIAGFIVFDMYRIHRDIKEVLFFFVLALVCESLTINLTNQISVSVVFALAVSVIMLFSPFGAGIIIALANMFSIYKRDGKYHHILNIPLYKTLFNGSNLFIATSTAGIIYRSLGNPGPDIVLSRAVLPVALGLIADVMINTTLVTLIISLVLRKGFIGIWTGNMRWVTQNLLIMSPLGIILAIAFQNYGYLGVMLFFGPLLMARYSFKLYVDLKSSYLETVEALSRALEAKDPITSGHSDRVVRYAVATAQHMKLSEGRIEKIRYAALLHDIGKIGVEDRILNKAGRLSDDELQRIRKHPVIGAAILEDIDFLRDASRIIRYHHERYDGMGYPEGKGGDEVPLESYILAVADAFDAMINDRPYRKALTVEDALGIIKQEAGKQFHPIVAGVFVKIVDKELLNGAD